MPACMRVRGHVCMCVCDTAPSSEPQVHDFRELFLERASGHSGKLSLAETPRDAHRSPDARLGRASDTGRAPASI